jgi:hypothetical protein
MTLRQITDDMIAKMRESGKAVAYCTGGHGYIDPAEVEGESHGTCPGPVWVVEPNPDAEQPEKIEGGIEREIEVVTDDQQRVLKQTEGKELSFSLRDNDGTEMTVCVRCLAAALGSHPLELILLAVNGAAVSWRSG